MNAIETEAGQRSDDGEDRAAEKAPNRTGASFKGCLVGGGWRGA
jgi:hypothetical protein